MAQEGISGRQRRFIQELSARRSTSPPPGDAFRLPEGLTVRARSAPELGISYKDIFLRGIYDLDSASPPRRLIDGGGHIGLTTLRWKLLYPAAAVTVFECDPMNLHDLRFNITANGVEAVTIVPAALGGATGRRPFAASGDEASALKADGATEVDVVCLSSYLGDRVDLLKLNIEGVELEVLREAEGSLPHVRHLIVEYHGFPELGQRLHEILELLDRAGFRYLIHDFDSETNPTTKPPFALDPQTRVFALIYARNMRPAPPGAPGSD